MKTIIDTLSEAFPFALDCEKWEKELINNMAYSEKAKSGDMLAGEGFKCKGAAFVIKGIIRVYRLAEDGRELTLYRIGPGETCILTMLCFLGDTDYMSYAVVEEDTTMVVLPHNVFNQLFDKSPLWRNVVFKALTNKITELMMFVEEVAFNSMDKRLAVYLYETALAKSTKELKMTHEQIATELGTAREVVSRILKTFERQGMVKLARGVVTVIPKELAAYQFNVK